MELIQVQKLTHDEEVQWATMIREYADLLLKFITCYTCFECTDFTFFRAYIWSCYISLHEDLCILLHHFDDRVSFGRRLSDDKLSVEDYLKDARNRIVELTAVLARSNRVIDTGNAKLWHKDSAESLNEISNDSHALDDVMSDGFTMNQTQKLAFLNLLSLHSAMLRRYVIAYLDCLAFPEDTQVCNFLKPNICLHLDRVIDRVGWLTSLFISPYRLYHAISRFAGFSFCDFIDHIQYEAAISEKELLQAELVIRSRNIADLFTPVDDDDEFRSYRDRKFDKSELADCNVLDEVSVVMNSSDPDKIKIGLLHDMLTVLDVKRSAVLEQIEKLKQSDSITEKSDEEDDMDRLCSMIMQNDHKK